MSLRMVGAASAVWRVVARHGRDNRTENGARVSKRHVRVCDG